jgi:outer membrane protein
MRNTLHLIGKYSISVFILAIMLTGVSRAQIMSLDDCIDNALKNNYSVLATSNAMNSAKGEVYSAYGQILPSINASAGRSKSWQGYVDYDSLGNAVGGSVTGNSYSGSITAAQTYPGLGIGTYGNIKLSKKNLASARYEYASAKSDLVLLVKANYYSVLKAKMLENVAKDAVKRGEERLRVAQSRYDLGSASMSDVLKAKVQFGNDKLDLVSKANATRLAMAQLAYTMGMDVNRDYQVADSLPVATFSTSFDQALGQALSENPVYRRTQIDLDAARTSKLIAWSNLLPSLSLSLSHGNGAGTYSEFTDFKRQNADYVARMSFSFNIFDGFNDYARIRSAKYTVRTNEENVANTKNNVALAVKEAFLDLDQATEQRKLSDESVASAQEDLNLVKEKYNLGAATILEVLDAEVSLKEAQTNQVQALYDYNLAISRLENAMGRQ